MFNPVIIKGNKQGIRLVIDNSASFEDILNCIRNKLKNTSCYYSNIKPIFVDFEGKSLTEDETELVLDTLREIGLNIASQNSKYQEITTQKKHEIPIEQSGLFFIGTLKSGQEIEAQTSIIIIGDVEEGASVISTGNIIVLGRLDGYAKAGISENSDAFVYAV